MQYLTVCRWPPSAVFESTPKQLLGLPSDPDSLGGGRGNAQVVAEALKYTRSNKQSDSQDGQEGVTALTS